MFLLNKKYLLLFFSFLLIIHLLTPDIVYAAWYDSLLTSVKSSGSNIATIFANLDGTGRVFIAIVKFFSVPVGIILVIIGILKFIRASDGKEQVSNGIYAFIAGLLLFSFMPSLDLLSNSIGLNGASVGLEKACNFSFSACENEMTSLSAYSKAGLLGVITFIRLLGAIALFRGIYAIYEAENKQNGAIWKAIGFIFGATLCWNVVAVALLVGNTVAPNSGFVDFIHDQNLVRAIK